MGFFLSRYALFLCVDIPLHYLHALANSLEPLNTLNATPEKYATHFTGQVCLHMVSQMFLRIVVNLALYALSEPEAIIHMTKAKVLLNPPAWKPSGLEANIPLLCYFSVPLYFNLRQFGNR